MNACCQWHGRELKFFGMLAALKVCKLHFGLDMFGSFRPLHVYLLPATMAVCRCNEAKPQDVRKAIRANLPLLEPKDATLCLEGFCSTHHELMKDILEITKRPTKQLLGKSLKKVFPSQEPQEVNGFVNALTTHLTSFLAKPRT